MPSLFAEKSTVREPQNRRPYFLFIFRRNKKNITHVGLYLSDGEFIHASRGKKALLFQVSIRATGDQK